MNRYIGQIERASDYAVVRAAVTVFPDAAVQRDARQVRANLRRLDPAACRLDDTPLLGFAGLDVPPDAAEVADIGTPGTPSIVNGQGQPEEGASSSPNAFQPSEQDPGATAQPPNAVQPPPQSD